jgi:hypothetical protein
MNKAYNVRKKVDNRTYNKTAVQFNTNNKSFNIKTLEKVGQKEYIEFGLDNLLPNQIINVLETSPKSGSIIKNLAKYIEGDGFNIEELDQLTIKFLENQFGDDDFEEILEKISLDLMYFGGFGLNVIWSNDGNSIAMVRHIPFQKIRIVNPDKSEEKEKYILSKDWADSKEKTKNVIVAGFDPEDKENKSQLLYVKKYTVGMDYYCLPHWFSSYKYTKLDTEIAAYQLNSAENGYTPSMLINLSTGIPSLEQQEEIAKKMDDKFKGSMGAKTILTFSEGRETAPELTVIDQTQADSKFINIEEMVLNNTLISNNITNPNLVGIRVPGELGGRDQLIDGFLLLQETFINNFQKIIEKKLNLLNYYSNGMNNNLTAIKIKQFNINKLIWKQE